MSGLKTEDIIEGNFIISDYNKLRKKSIGIIQNVRKAVESGRRSEGNDPKELAYDIYFPETDQKEDVCEHSGVTSEAQSISAEDAEIFLEEKIHENNEKILTLKKRNISIRKAFKIAFENAPAI